METNNLPFEKKMLEERISLAINQERNKFKDLTGLDIKSIEVKFTVLETGDGISQIFLDGVSVELSI